MNNYSKMILYLKMISGIGFKTIEKFISKIDNYKTFMNMSLDEIKNKLKTISNKKIEKIYYNKEKINMDSYIIKLNKMNTKILNNRMDEYSYSLKNIKEVPKLLHLRGTSCLNDKCISIIGSRKATEYGKKVSYLLGKKLAESGFTVVSGMAKGIDTYAHLGALKAKGRTIAVLGSGIDIIYPKTNSDLYFKIINSGAVISEFKFGTKPKSYNFPRRNRIISGLSDILIVVEATKISGSLITVNFALKQGKEIYAVPNNIFSKNSEGVNMLLRDGANPIISINNFVRKVNKYYRK